MAGQFLGEIRIVPFNFAPIGWALCDGQILPLSQYSALFSLLGTFYGGNGTSNFGLPNLQGNVAMDFGSGVGLTPRDIGETGGVQNVTLLQTEIPSHNHLLNGDSDSGANLTPTGNLYAVGPAPPRVPAPNLYAANQSTSPIATHPSFIQFTGGNLPHNNQQPYLVLNFVIALAGIYPTRQ